MAESYCLGLISGTSVDGIDAALISIDGDRIRLLAHHAHDYPQALRAQLLALPGQAQLSLVTYGELDNAVAQVFSAAAQALIAAAGLQPSQIQVIGSHGQNIWHAPDRGVSLQIGNPNIIAASTGIPVVADFRRKDLALGGEGAPLAPGFHQALFAHPDEPRGVLNLGGIANLSVLEGGTVIGFDTGPASALMDEWIAEHLQQRFDRDGAWAASGTANPALLARLLADAYLQRPPPKSTGREHYNRNWLQSQLASLEPMTPVDVQATLLAYTVESVALAIEAHAPSIQRLLVCGGGSHNQALVRQLQARISVPVATTTEYGFDADWIEAGAFAWFAWRSLQQLNSSKASVTGANRDAVLGGIYWP